MRILYVESHEVFADLVVRKFLVEHEVVVAVGRSPAERALEASAEPFDAVLVDFDLEDEPGDALVRHLRRGGFDGLVVGTASHEKGEIALRTAGVDAICPKTELDEVDEILRSARSVERRPAAAAALPGPVGPDPGDVLGLALHARDGSGHGRLIAAIENDGLVLRLGLDSSGRPLEERALGELLSRLEGGWPEGPDLANLGLDLDLADASRAAGWSSRAELEARLAEHYRPGPEPPVCQLRLRIELTGERSIVLDSGSDAAFLLPWTIIRPGRPVGRAFDAGISRALAALVPPGFATREVLLGRSLLDDLSRSAGIADDEPQLIAPGPGPLTPLMEAAAAGRIDEVEALLAAGAAVDASDDRGRTALVHALEADHLKAEMNLLKVATALLDAGADLTATDEDGRTALDHAIRVEDERRLALEVDRALSSPGLPFHGSIGPHRRSLRRLLEDRLGR